jgi:hypothetical protein
LPEQFRAKAVTFGELADDAIEWAKAHKLTWEDDQIRLKPLREEFGNRSAESMTPQEIERWFASKGVSRNRDKTRIGRSWKPATYNRYKALLSMVYRQGIKNRRVTVNPAREIERRRENNQRDHYMLPWEETAFREVLSTKCSERTPELDRGVLTVPRSKNGEKRRVFLNDSAVAAFRLLWRFSDGKGKVFAHLYRSNGGLRRLSRRPRLQIFAGTICVTRLPAD